MKDCFKNKVVLITGAAQGIGLATAKEFACVGANVVMADIVDTKKQIEELKESGYSATPYICDVSKENQVQKMIKDIVKEFGSLDCAFNNAGVQTPQRPMAQITFEKFGIHHSGCITLDILEHTNNIKFKKLKHNRMRKIVIV